MKQKIKKILVIACAVILLNSTATVIAASEKSDGENMEKVLQCFKKKQIKKLKQYNRKMSRYANERCVRNMPSSMKSAYLKALRGYNTSSSAGGKYLWGYYLTDIDNDGAADMVVQYGSSESDVALYVYQFKGGRAVKVRGKIEANHADVYAYPKHKGIILYRAVRNADSLIHVKINNGRLTQEEYPYRLNVDDYLPLRCQLKSHTG